MTKDNLLLIGAGALALLFLTGRSQATNQTTYPTTFTELTDVPSSYTGQENKFVAVNSSADGLLFIPIPIPPAGIATFAELTDVPNSYNGQANNMVTVNSTENGLSFIPIPIPPAGIATFTELTDAPNSYSGQANNMVTVNSTENGLLFIPIPIPPAGITTFAELADVQNSYNGQANKLVSVNSTEDGLVFTQPPSIPHIPNYDSPIYIDNIGTGIYHSHDTQLNFDSTSYIKLKTIILDNLPDTTLKIYFELFANGTQPFYGRIYRNGIPVGIEQISIGYNFPDGYRSYTETIGSWSPGDTLELWGRLTDFAYGGKVRNLRILGTIRNNVNS